jgi:hypothetical protein
MPLEGHYARQNTPLYKLSRREIRVAILILVITFVSILGIVIATAGDSNPPPAIGCINPTVAGIVGAETLNRCGQEAVDTCSHAAEFTGARAETIVANCEKQRVKF